MILTDIVTFFRDGMGLNTIDLHNINFLMIVLMMMVVLILFLLELLLGVVDLNNLNHIKKDRQRTLEY